MKNNSKNKKNENSILYPILITVGIFLLVVLFIWASSKKDDSNSSSEATTESIQDVTSSENKEEFSSEIESSTETNEETTTETNVEESSEETSSEASSETEESSIESTTEAETSTDVEISTEMSSEDITTTNSETEEPTTTTPVVVPPTTEAEPEPTMSIEVDENKDLSLGEELEIVDIGKYTGLFFEDGTDEVVSNIVMLVVKNISNKDLQYAEIELTTDMRTLNFYVTTLKAGASVLVLELNRQSYILGEEYVEAKLNNDIFFQSELTVYEDVFKIGALDGAMNVTNISDKDITGEVIIYYKNRSSDMYYGGITYRTRIPGIKAGEIKQIMLKHFSPTGSEIMFVTYTE